ncbi:MAG: Flp family type IVb pilin [Rickettsiales bacterium]|nr:Flp family type IVb pilin [Rickettsiales bacterium]
MRLWLAFWKDESGTALIEYGLIATIVSIIAIGSMIAIGAQVGVFFNDMLTSFR